MAGDALGYIACGCGKPAAIKKLKNSALLYSHCSTCGCDRRTGEHVQAQFRAAVGVMEIPDNSGAVPENETAATPDVAGESPEWKPTPETHRADDSRIIPESGVGDVGRKMAAAALFALAGVGFMFKVLKG